MKSTEILRLQFPNLIIGTQTKPNFRHMLCSISIYLRLNVFNVIEICIVFRFLHCQLIYIVKIEGTFVVINAWWN